MKLQSLFGKKDQRPVAAHKSKEEWSRLLLKEYERVFALFREHPFISITEVTGAPPETYRVTYLVDGLVHSGKSIESISEHAVEISLTGAYPDDPPAASMARPAYHPNIDALRMDLKDLWLESPTLADCIVGIGEMIVYQRYSLDAPLNAEAAQWAMRNKSLLPLSKVDLRYHEPVSSPGPRSDASANLAGGPTARIDDEGTTKAIVLDNDTSRIDMQPEPAPDSPTMAATPDTSISPQAPKPQPTVAAAPSIKAPKPQPTVSVASSVKLSQLPKKENIPSHSIKPEVENGKKPKGVDSKEMPNAPKEALKPVEQTPASSPPVIQMPSIDDRKTPPLSATSMNDAYCPACGSKNNATANYCTRCGIKLSTKASQRIAKAFFIVGIIAIPIIIIEMGAIIILLNKKSPESAATVETSQNQVTYRQSEVAAVTPPSKPETVKEPPAAARAPLEKEREITAEVKIPVKKAKAIRKKEPVEEDADADVEFGRSSSPIVSKSPAASVTDNLKLGKLYLGIGSYDDAIKRFNEVLSADPSNKEAKEGIEKAKKMKVRQ
jgi:ubiquitin-protein ligase